MYCDEGTLRRLSVAARRESAGDDRAAALRLLVYSHDAQGLGHLRRNLLITRALISAGLSPSVLMLSGLREAAAYEFPPGVDSVTLPGLSKGRDGVYASRSLPLGLGELLSIRRSIIAGAVSAAQPDVVLVDKLPLGILAELEPALAGLRAAGRTRLILGLRDILDDAETVRNEWQRGRYVEAIRRYYDEIWVYGDRRICDQGAEYGLPEDVREKIRYVGYLNPRDVGEIPETTQPQSAHTLSSDMDLPDGSLTLCLVGGGRDGAELANAFLDARLPAGHGGVLVCGPLMSAEDRGELRARSAGRSDVRIIEFVTDPQPLLCCADRIICMGGYNTICETLAFHKPALVVPRVEPRREQWIRARRLADLGLLDVLEPDRLSGRAIGDWLASPVASRPVAEHVIDFGGVPRLPELLQRALTPVRFPGKEPAAHA